MGRGVSLLQGDARSLLRRVAPLAHGRIQWNRRLLTSAVDESPSQSHDGAHMMDNCIRVPFSFLFSSSRAFEMINDSQSYGDWRSNSNFVLNYFVP